MISMLIISDGQMGVSENVGYPKNPMVLLIIIPMKNMASYHWED